MAPERDKPFKPRCLSLDLEVGKEDGRIHTFGAVHGDAGHGYHDGSLGGNLDQQPAMVARSPFVTLC